MNVKSLSDATLLAVWRALDSEVRKRKVKNTMPVGTFTVDADSLVIPAGTIERKEAFRAPTIHASPLAMAAFIGQKSGSPCILTVPEGVEAFPLSRRSRRLDPHPDARIGVHDPFFTF